MNSEKQDDQITSLSYMIIIINKKKEWAKDPCQVKKKRGNYFNKFQLECVTDGVGRKSRRKVVNVVSDGI